MTGFTDVFSKLLIQLILWTVVFSIPYNGERVFDLSRRLLIENQLVQTISGGLLSSVSSYSDLADSSKAP